MQSLNNAMRAFVSIGLDRGKMDVNEWATTFNVGAEDVRAAWEAAATRHSLGQHNNGEDVE